NENTPHRPHPPTQAVVSNNDYNNSNYSNNEGTPHCPHPLTQAVINNTISNNNYNNNDYNEGSPHPPTQAVTSNNNEYNNEYNNKLLHKSIIKENIINLPEKLTLLTKINNQINILTPRKNLYLKILDLIKHREDLLIEISIFEKQSSDPKRLKGSSLILFKEEAFRKKSIPKLFQIESYILTQIQNYESAYFTDFIFKNVVYKLRLKNEIKNRSICLKRDYIFK
ncbi:hypothetical protein CDIK_1372, partial [Cucumispora dikerogammari]